MNEQVNNILFWASFVGVAIFIVNSIYATIVLRHIKDKQFKPPDLMFTALATTMAVMFMALSVSMHINKSNTPATAPQSITKPIEYHTKVGYRIEWNDTKKKYDTIDIFEKRK